MAMDSEKESEADPESSKEAMIRWQGYARESRTAVNSHFLAYAAAVLAMQTTILLDEKTTQIHWPCIFSTGGILALGSLLLGSAIVLLRLQDARLTARVARYRHQKRPASDIERMRKAAHCYGGWTNTLIPWQVISFAGAAAMFLFWVAATAGEKLW